MFEYVPNSLLSDLGREKAQELPSLRLFRAQFEVLFSDLSSTVGEKLCLVRYLSVMVIYAFILPLEYSSSIGPIVICRVCLALKVQIRAYFFESEGFFPYAIALFR